MHVVIFQGFEVQARGKGQVIHVLVTFKFDTDRGLATQHRFCGGAPGR